MFSFLKWIRFSNIKLSIDLNPFVWSFKATHQGPTHTDPHLSITYIRILPLSFAFIFDNGDWIPWEETIEPGTQGTGGDAL